LCDKIFIAKKPMQNIASCNWESAIVSPERLAKQIKPGMSIFLGTAMAEPRTTVRHLMTSGVKNLEDLELIQLVSIGDAVSLRTLQSQPFCRGGFRGRRDLPAPWDWLFFV
jgi:hypothetical protein